MLCHQHAIANFKHVCNHLLCKLKIPKHSTCIMLTKMCVFKKNQHKFSHFYIIVNIIFLSSYTYNNNMYSYANAESLHKLLQSNFNVAT